MKRRFISKIFFIVFILASACAHAGQNKVVVITGASRGVGLATAEYLAQNGYIVYGTSRNPPTQSNQNIHFLRVDLQDANSIQKAVQAILDKEGHIDILINNAAFAVVGPIESLTEQEMHDQMEVNFFAAVRFIQAVLPSMRAQKSGQIINISSTNAILSPPFGSMYGASKAALESMSESLAVEVAPYHISVSIVEPGLIQTRFELPMGTREIPNDTYKPVTDVIRKEIKERYAHPEHLFPSQTAQEIAEFLYHVIQDPNPKLRYQTSENARELVSKKLIDLTGEIYLKEIKN